MNLDERWKLLVVWWARMETRTQIMLEQLADSGHSFAVLVALFTAVLVMWIAT